MSEKRQESLGQGEGPQGGGWCHWAPLSPLPLHPAVLSLGSAEPGGILYVSWELMFAYNFLPLPRAWLTWDNNLLASRRVAP